MHVVDVLAEKKFRMNEYKTRRQHPTKLRNVLYILSMTSKIEEILMINMSEKNESFWKIYVKYVPIDY